jgi:hypothetical protein
MNRKTKLVILTVLSALILGSLACTIVVGPTNPVGSAEAATKTADSPIQPTATMQFPDSEIPPGGTYLGDTIARGGYFFSASAFEDPAVPSRTYDPATGFRLVAVFFTVGNQAGGQIMLLETDFQLRDSKGILHEFEAAARPGRFPAVTIDPGERAQGWIAFSIPEDVQAESVVCTFGIGSKARTVELGVVPAPEGNVPLEVNTSRTPPALSRLGEKAANDGYSLTALAVEDPAESASPLMYSPQDGWHLAAVRIAAVNTGNKQDLNVFDPSELALVDTDGFLYAPEFFGRTGSIEGGDFPLGAVYEGWVSFTIPDGIRLESVKYINSRVYGRVYAGLAE